MTDPTKLVIELRPLPAKLSDGQPWPWNQRRKHLLKQLLRQLGFKAEILSETYPPEPEATNQEATK